MLQVRKVSHVQCRNTVELHLFPSPVILLCKSPINWPTPHGVCLKNELNHREYVNWNDTSRCQLPCESILNQVYNPRNERCKKVFLVILIHVTRKSALLGVSSGFYPHVRHPSSNESFPWKWFCGSVVLWYCGSGKLSTSKFWFPQISPLEVLTIGLINRGTFSCGIFYAEKWCYFWRTRKSSVFLPFFKVAHGNPWFHGTFQNHYEGLL